MDIKFFLRPHLKSDALYNVYILCKSLFRFLFLLSCICITILTAKAQGLRNSYQSGFTKNVLDSLEENESKINQLLFETSYMSQVTYWGRTFGISQYGISPSLVYINKSGFFGYYTGYYWSGEDTRYAKTDLGIGYQVFLTERLYVSAEYNRWIFNNGDDLTKRRFTNILDSEINYDFGPFNIGGNYYVMFGTEWSHVLSFELLHEISWYKLLTADKISVTPTYSPTFATVNRLPINAASSVNIQKGSFGIVNHEFWLPLQYKVYGKMELIAAYHYAFPVNPAKGETLRPFGYFTLDISFPIKRWLK